LHHRLALIGRFRFSSNLATVDNSFSQPRPPPTIQLETKPAIHVVQKTRPSALVRAVPTVERTGTNIEMERAAVQSHRAALIDPLVAEWRGFLIVANILPGIQVNGSAR
jgi:hypothetical protein